MPSQLDSLIEQTKQVILSFTLDFLRETLEACDEAIRNSDIRKQHFTIVRKDTKTLFTTLGSFSFQKIYFNGDGGPWMKPGIQMLEAALVLDEFHIQKYVRQITSYVMQEKEERKNLRQKLLSFLKQGKKAFCQWLEETLSSISQEKKKNKI